MTSEAVERGEPASVADRTESLRREMVRIEKRVAQLSDTISRSERRSGPLPMEEFLQPLRRAKSAWDHRRAAGQPQKKIIKVVDPSGITLPAHSALRREPPRKPADQQPDYLEKFDSRTLYYDAFRHEDGVWLSGPPLRNLRSALEGADWRVDGVPVNDSLSLSDWGRTQRSRIVDAPDGNALTLTVGGTAFSMDIAPDESDLFAGQRAIITVSKDNDLVWLKDYLHYYHVVHGVTGIVFYDNNSTRYSPQDVADAIAEVDGITTAVVVAWNYPWGAERGPNNVWDSDYCQYSLLEHGRFRYLTKAAGVINADIDELVLADDGRSAFEHAAESETGVVTYHGHWMAMATSHPMSPTRQRRFVDYRHRTGKAATAKWTLLPGHLDWRTTQWRVHSVDGSGAQPTTHLHHRHYQGITNGWKYDRTEVVAKPGAHLYDVRMSRVLDLVFDN
ncbi:capsule biosynthesis protein CapZ [Streptomyces longispororuber]|uniref:capsule biosynthesis protein CapZ n=1 Tax=Streptomyces longispororuber TaxID=68230 RepID=UPI00210DD298|nr:capsule biosynthesis protein CapZ [Streptomyces longispororuber]MCQ4210559.1 capsule biosynthesis protein CapZ [Streptomyces longispororuber]